MRKLPGVLLFALVLVWCSSALAGTQEDLEFARGLFARKWYDWATEVAEDLIDSSRTSTEIRGWAAELQVAILNQQGKETGDETYRQKAEALTAKYQRMFPDHPAWGAAAVFALLQRRLDSAQDLAKKAEVEPNKEKRAQLTADAVKIFEEVSSRWEDMIKKFRLEVAAYPAEHKWAQWASNVTPQVQNELLDKVWKRNLAEYLYSTSFLYYAKVVPKEKKDEIVQKGLKKFKRFIDGEPEFDGDVDPPPAEEKAPWDAEPRTTFGMLIYLAEIGIGQCYVEVGQYEEAVGHFDYMVQAELPYGSEDSEQDIRRIVDIRLQAFYLEGYAYNLAKKHEDAVRILQEMFAQSGEQVAPDRPKMVEYWEKEKKPELAFMPNVRENVYGKLAAFQLAKALTALGRFSEGIEEAYKIFVIEQATRKGGQVSPFEVEAAKTMAELSKEVSTVKFPVGAAYAVARGFHYQEQWSDAIAAYKKVYGAPGSPDEQREYAPKALFELGKLLYTNERYLEAGIALAEVCERFQDFPQINQAATLLKQAYRKVRELAKQSGKLTKFEEDAFEEAKKIAQKAVPASLGPIKDQFTQAAEYAKEGNYTLAAETYEDIPKNYKEASTGGEMVMKAVPFYAYARAQLGYCSYMLYLRSVKTDPKEALEMLKKTTKILEEALNEAAEAEDVRAEVTARYYLAKTLTEDLWKDDEAKDNAKKTLEYLAPFKEKFKAHKTAVSYMPDVLATMALAQYKLQNYDKMHTAFQELEKKHATSPILERTSFVLYELMRKQGDTMGAASQELAAPYYEKAAYYVYAWYEASGDKLKAESYLWAGSALHDTGAYDKATEVLEKYFGTLPPADKRSEKQNDQATTAKILLAQARFGMGDYEAAAGLFDLLRRALYCPRCKYEKVVSPEDFDKAPDPCPKCNREGFNLEKKHDAVLAIQEGAAKSYLAIYEEKGMKDMIALNKAQDIYQRIFKRLEGAAKEELRQKYWEVGYTILKIYYYKRDFDRVVGEIKNLILLSSDQANPDNPSEEDWKRVIPVQPWRNKIKELYEKSLKASSGK